MDRFLSKVDKRGPNDCWNWKAGKLRGYGAFSVGFKMHRAYRWFYEQTKGPVPHGLHLDHLCRNPACVNPAHLEPVTQRENTLRGDGPSARAARKTKCNKGHELDGVRKSRYGKSRYCKTCKWLKQQIKSLSDKVEKRIHSAPARGQE